MTILIIVGIIVLLGIFFASMYNSLVKLRNNREMRSPTSMYS